MTLPDALKQLAEYYDELPPHIIEGLTEMFNTNEEVILALWN